MFRYFCRYSNTSAYTEYTDEDLYDKMVQDDFFSPVMTRPVHNKFEWHLDPFQMSFKNLTFYDVFGWEFKCCLNIGH